jgi:drug/metabolite transporter (DMT)-like permease
MRPPDQQSRPAQPVPQEGDVRPYVGLGIGVLTVSSAAILIRLAQAGAHSLTVAAWRLTLATLLLTPVAVAQSRREWRTLTADEWRRALLSGLLLAVHFVTWITSLSLTSVAASVVLMTTHPIFAALGSYLLLDEGLERRMIIALVIAVLGSGIIAIGDVGQGSHRLLGDLLALLGGISAAGYFVLGRGLRKRLSLLGYVYPVYGTAAVVLMGTLLISGLPRLPEQPEAWLWLGVMALGPQILGHSSLNWALRYLSATFVTLATLGEPIGSTLLAWWLLGERPTIWAVVGGTLILGGIVVASRAERPGVSRDSGEEEARV